MDIVTQYLETNHITLSDCDIKRLHDIVQPWLIIPGQAISTKTVRQKFFTNCSPSDNTKGIEDPVTCILLE